MDNINISEMVEDNEMVNYIWADMKHFWNCMVIVYDTYLGEILDSNDSYKVKL